MEIILPLVKMTIEEKINTMETIWNDLCKNEDNVLSPAWHEDILQRREKDVEKDIEKFIDWDTAKKKLLDTVS